MTSSAASTRILLVDDHDALREALAGLLHMAGDSWQVTQAAGGAQALQALEAATFDAAVVDLSMPGMNGFELIARIGKLQPALPVLMLSMHDEEPYALRALKVGARGYLMKDRAGAELVPAVRRVLAGGLHLSPPLAKRVLVHLGGTVAMARHAGLSSREFEVLRRLSAGETASDVARAMDLPEAAIASSRDRILAKLDLGTVAELLRYGAENGLDTDLTDLAAPPNQREDEPARRLSTL